MKHIPASSALYRLDWKTAQWYQYVCQNYFLLSGFTFIRQVIPDLPRQIPNLGNSSWAFKYKSHANSGNASILKSSSYFLISRSSFQSVIFLLDFAAYDTNKKIFLTRTEAEIYKKQCHQKNVYEIWVDELLQIWFLSFRLRKYYRLQIMMVIEWKPSEFLIGGIPKCQNDTFSPIFSYIGKKTKTNYNTAYLYTVRDIGMWPCVDVLLTTETV